MKYGRKPMVNCFEQIQEDNDPVLNTSTGRDDYNNNDETGLKFSARSEADFGNEEMDEIREENENSNYDMHTCRRGYRLGRSLGHGAFGEVLLALDKTGEFFAVKRIIVNSEKKRRTMQREINFYTTLRHPHLVRYIGYNELEDGVVHILLEWQPGGSIHSLISEFGNPGLELEIIQLVTYQVVSALAFLHSKGVVHHDIKGANILYSDTDPRLGPIAKLTDFGCSLRDDDEDLTESLQHQLRGTILWMAPEAARQKPGRPADIWALGATVVEMYSGKPPFSHFKNQIAALSHIALLEEPPPLPIIPTNDLARKCADFLSLCFKLDPNERPKITELAMHSFITGHLGTKSTSTPKRRSRRRTDMSLLHRTHLRDTDKISLQESVRRKKHQTSVSVPVHIHDPIKFKEQHGIHGGGEQLFRNSETMMRKSYKRRNTMQFPPMYGSPGKSASGIRNEHGFRSGRSTRDNIDELIVQK
eukprot:CAMPEP_0204871472 /NCGR_PEP_ID=MMETSP1348-20121228/35465_1 /ASSEMBLY_ACC=CAM_ASM_000700 /TAXON_ID=215587 /ORGANISM="Aplanochytrium stocchinoi, Strain GSBS06" /LENGTH=474 /DNA_ID=CAMNT_0052025767 /DNA_START=35 /DNA_END=1459 /DNA_ORIENTATION=+